MKTVVHLNVQTLAEEQHNQGNVCLSVRSGEQMKIAVHLNVQTLAEEQHN